MNKKLFLIVGQSGVGKSTLCSKAVQECSRIAHIKASDFVRKLSPARPSQTDLVRRIRAQADVMQEDIILVDGHLILRGMRVPEEAVQVLAPNCILVITDSVEHIQGRRRADSTRSREEESNETIAENQQAEVKYALELGDNLGTHVLVLEKADWEEFITALNKLFR